MTAVTGDAPIDMALSDGSQFLYSIDSGFGHDQRVSNRSPTEPSASYRQWPVSRLLRWDWLRPDLRSGFPSWALASAGAQDLSGSVDPRLADAAQVMNLCETLEDSGGDKAR